MWKKLLFGGVLACSVFIAGCSEGSGGKILTGKDLPEVGDNNQGVVAPGTPSEVPEVPKVDEVKPENKEPEKKEENAENDNRKTEPDVSLSEAQKFVFNLVNDEEKLTSNKNGVINSCPNAKMKIALTFDDGPFTATTQEYLDILAEYDVPATFFVLGQYVYQHPDLAKKMVDAGHELGSHSWYHHKLMEKDAEFVKKDFEKTQKAFEDATGSAPVLFRPPYGAKDADFVKTIESFNMQTVMWNVDPKDWSAKVSEESVYQEIMKYAQSGSIVLLHENKKLTMAVLPRVIKDLQEKGYEFVTVSEIIYAQHEAEVAKAEKAKTKQ